MATSTCRTRSGSLHNTRSRIFPSLVGTSIYCTNPKSLTVSKNCFCKGSVHIELYDQSPLGQFGSPVITEVTVATHKEFKQSIYLFLKKTAFAEVPPGAYTLNKRIAESKPQRISMQTHSMSRNHFEI